MAQFLYLIRPSRPGFLTAPTLDEQARVSEHFAYLVGLSRRGVVLLAGRTQNSDETTFGIVIFEARTPEEAHDVMRGDPAVQAGVFAAELFPYQVAIVSPRIADAAASSG